MQTRAKIILFIAFICLSGTVVADRPVETGEILKILNNLTSRPKKSWLVCGTIQARHEEFHAAKTTDPSEINSTTDGEIEAYLKKLAKLELDERLSQMKLEAIPFNVRYELSNEYRMVSNVNLTFDSKRFYWEIVIDSRTDSVKPEADLAGNFYTEQFDLKWNQNRVFAWDGEKYITYFRPGNSAIITAVPGAVNGPLTAGVIPWGHGRYSYERLLKAKLSAVAVKSDTLSEIHLTVTRDGREEIFVLDCSKEYALKNYTSTSNDGSMTVQNYGAYQLVNGRWCPGVIMIEQFDTTTAPPKLMASSLWYFISISGVMPEESAFDVEFEYDALIEDFRFGSKPLRFRYLPPEAPSAKNVDVAELLQSRLQIADSAKVHGQNCATISLKYVCGELGIRTSWEDLSEIVHGSEKKTSLLEMKEFVDQLGLSSLAAKTNLAELKALGDYQAILHLPIENHYVVLGEIGDEYVRLIDLDNNNFYYRLRIEHFERIWGNTALILSNKDVAHNGGFARIEDRRLNDIMGAASCQACNTKIHDPNVYACEPPTWPCGGYRRESKELWGCGPETTSGSCSETEQPASLKELCIPDPDENCVGNGEQIVVYSMQACYDD
ncbi:MAG: cysteine peptidase family C39 domain-containing protein [Planctomycetota bacterium]|jgi:hypothetical protein